MIVEAAPAKLNLALHVRARRTDGYHELETLFAFVADGDSILLSLRHPGENRDDEFVVSGPFAAALSGEGDNLVLRAVRAFDAAFGPGGPLRIELVKNLPVASGIGGGSADAAATLRALARLRGIALDEPALFAIADGLGSDVPACLLGRTAIGTGRGEQLVPVEGLADTPVLLVNPGIAVSTAEVFRRWDGVDRGPLPEGPLLDRALHGRNDLEAPALAAAPVIGDLLDALRSQPGVTLARMSGSGATCFALFDAADGRDAAGAALRERGWWCLETALV